MANYGAQIFNNAISSLAAQQAVIANTSSNITNVNTEGYARRSLHLQTRVSYGKGSGFSVGNGVEIGELARVSDTFLNGVVRDATSDSEGYAIQQEFLKRVESLFSLSGEQNTIGSTLTDFYTAVDNLSADPASIELRSELVARAQDLTTTIKQTYDGLANLQDEADQRLVNEVSIVNNLTAQIAQLNGLISGREGNGNVAADERDKRDLLLQSLAEKIGFEMVEASDGSVMISLASGFPLVSGPNSRNLEFTNTLPPAPPHATFTLRWGFKSHSL
ncbi:flagellar hook-associated protein FlgK [Oligoflexia bacterium]|nr:flagellar hook-associated protein FlgK [Oligoflexia bacterium]